MLSTRARLALITLLSSLPVHFAHAAPDGGYWDFRFGAGIEPSLTKSHYEPAGAPAADDNSWDASGGSFEFNASHRFSARGPASGYIIMGAYARGFSGDDTAKDTVDLSALGLQFGGGFSLKPNAIYSLEIGPRLGLGVSSFSETAPGTSKIDGGSGAYARFDLGIANIFTFRKFQVSAIVGAASWAAAGNYDRQTIQTTGGPITIPSTDVTYSGAGAYATVSLGFR